MSEYERFTCRAPHGTFVVVDCPNAIDVALRGEFDLSSTGPSQQVIEHVGELLGGTPRPICIEMSAVSFFDAAGIKFLLQLERLAHLAGTTSSVQHPNRDVYRLLELVGCQRMVDDR